jgi:osmoprotectant transport system substrate-binding protein
MRIASLNAAASAVLLCCGIIGCHAKPPNTSRVVVGSKNFSEQAILGEIVGEIIEKNTAIKVERKFYLGDTLDLHQALISGDIDIYPEYSGTALRDVLRIQEIPSSNTESIKLIKREYLQKWNIEWLEPLGFSDSFVLAIGVDDSRASRIQTLTEASQDQTGWKMGVGDEFNNRPDGLPGMLDQYPLRLLSPPKVYNLQDLYRAQEEGEVDMIVGDSTDGLLNRSHVKVLIDDKGFFPSYDAFVLVREDVMDKHPELRKVLAQLSGRISDEDMREMNYEVDGDHMDIKKVADIFLKKKGL